MAQSKLASVKRWEKNFVKSIKYSAENYAEMHLSVPFQIKNTYSEQFKAVQDVIRKNKNDSSRIDRMITSSPAYKTIKETYKNALSDLKTGKLYNKEREEQSQDEQFRKEAGMDEFDDFENMNFDDESSTNEDSSFDSLNKEATKNLSNDINSGFAASTNTLSNAIMTGNAMMSDTVRASSQLLFSQIVETNRLTKLGFEALNTTTKQILDFNKNVVTQHFANSVKFYETTTNYLAENNAMMKELLEMQRNLYKQQQVSYAAPKEGTFSDITLGGVPTPSKYMSLIKKNFENSALGGLFGIMSMGGSDIIKTNPLSLVSDALFSTLLGPKLDKSLKNSNKLLGGLFGSAMNKMNRTADTDFGPLGILSELFGIRTNEKTKIDPSKFIKGPMAYNGYANMSLVEVMPSYLSRIEAALTGGPERLFDMKTGKWTTLNKTRDNFNRNRDKSLQFALSDFTSAIKSNLRNINFGKDKRSQSQLYSDFESFIRAIIPENGFYDYGYDKSTGRTSRGSNKKYGVSSQKNMDIIASIIESIPGYKKMGLSGNIRNWKDQRSADLELLEKNPGVIERLLFNDFSSGNKNGSINSRFKSGQKAWDSSPIASSLNGIYRETYLIRSMLENGRGIGSGRHSNNGPTRPSGPANNAWKRKQQWDKTNKSKVNTFDILGISDDSFYTNENGIKYSDADIQKAIRENARKIQNESDNFSDDGYGGFFGNSFKKKYTGMKGKSGLDKIRNAKGLTDQMTAVTGFMMSLRDKPAQFMANLIDGVNNSIYNFFYDRPSEVIDKNGKKISGFFNVMTYELKTGISSVVNDLRENIISPLSNYIDSLSDDSIIKRTKNKMGSVANYAINKVKGAFGRVFNDTKANSSKDTFAGDMWSKLRNYSNGGRADGDRYISKSGIYALSEGEAVIPSDLNPFNPNMNTADRRKDAKREQQIIKNAKKYGIATKGGYASGTASVGSDSIFEKLLNTMVEMKDAVVDMAKQSKIGSRIISAFSDNKKETEVEKSAIDKLKDIAPDVFTGSAIGGLGGLMVTGGPMGILAGAAIGSGVMLAKKSKAVEDFMLGKADEKGERNPKGGLLGKGAIGLIRKYWPTVSDYGIVGGVAGALTPFGVVGGLLIGSAIGFAKKNDKVNEFFFGKDGDKNKNKMQDMLSNHMGRLVGGAAIGTLAGTAIAGPFGAVGGLLIGSGLSFASTTDKFKDMMLGVIDKKTGKRKGGVLGMMKSVMVDPLADRMKGVQDDISKYLKDEVFKPLKKGLEPFGQLMKVGARDMFSRIQDIVTGSMRPSKLKYLASKFMNTSMGRGTKGGVLGFAASTLMGIDPMLGLGIGGLGALAANTKAGRWLGRNTLGLIPKAYNGVTNKLGALSDYTDRRLIASGNAENLSASERYGMMAGRDYKYRGFDESVAKANSEELQNALNAIQGIKGNKKAMQSSLMAQEDTMLNLLSNSGISGNDRGAILTAMKGGDTPQNRRAMQDAWSRIDRSSMTEGEKRKLKNSLMTASAKYAKSNSMIGSTSAMQSSLKSIGIDTTKSSSLDKYERMLKSEIGFRGVKGNEYLTPEDNPNTVTNTNLSMIASYSEAMSAYMNAMVVKMNGGTPDLSELRKIQKKSDLSSISSSADTVIKSIENSDKVEQHMRDLGVATNSVQIGNRRNSSIEQVKEVSNLFGGNISREDSIAIADARAKNPKSYKIAVGMLKRGIIKDASAFREIVSMESYSANKVNNISKNGIGNITAETAKSYGSLSNNGWKRVNSAARSGLKITNPEAIGNMGYSTRSNLNEDIRALQSNGISISQSDHEKLLTPEASVARADIRNALANGDITKVKQLLGQLKITAVEQDARSYNTKAGTIGKTISAGFKAINTANKFGYEATMAPLRMGAKGIRLAASGLNNLLNIKTELANAKNAAQVQTILNSIQNNRIKKGNLSSSDISDAIKDNPNLSAEEKSTLNGNIPGFAFGGKIIRGGLAALSSGELVTSAKNIFGSNDAEKDSAGSGWGRFKQKIKDAREAREERSLRDVDGKRGLGSKLWGLTKNIAKGAGNYFAPDAMALGGAALGAASYMRGNSSNIPSSNTGLRLDKNNEQTVSTPYGIQTYKKSTNGSYALDDTKQNKSISDKMAADADIKQESVQYLRIIAQNTINGGAGMGAGGIAGKAKGNMDLGGGGGLLDSIMNAIPFGSAILAMLPDKIKNGIKKIARVVTSPVRWAGRKIMAPFNWAGRKIKAGVGLAKDAGKVALDFGKDIASKAKAKAIDTAKDIGKKGIGLAKSGFDIIKDGAGKVGAAAQGKVGEAISAIKSALTKISEVAASKIPKGMASKLGALCEGIMKKITSPKAIAGAATKAAKQGAMAGSAATGVGLVITAGIVAYTFYDGWSSASKYFNVKDGDATISQKLVSGFTNALISMVPFLGWFMDGGDVIAIAKSIFGNDLSDSGSSNKDDDSDDSSGTKDKLADKSSIFGGAVNSIEEFGKSVYESAKGIASTVMDTGKAGISWIWSRITNIGDSLKGGVASLTKAVADHLPSLSDIKQGAADAWGSIKQGASDDVDWIANKGASIKNSIKNSLFGGSKYGKGIINPFSFASQLSPGSQMQYNAPGDTEYQTMADSGCGPGAAANAIAGLGGNLDISSAANYALDNGYKEKDGGTKPGFFSSILNKMGVSTDNVSNNTPSIMNNLKQGNPVILMGKDSKVSDSTPYGPGPHYVTATGMDDQGNLIVQDSESNGPNKIYDAGTVIGKSSIAIAARPKTRTASAIRADSNPKYKGGGNPNAKGKYGRYRFGRSTLTYFFGRGAKAGPTIYSTLQSLGFSAVGAAGVMGNMMQESTLYPDMIEGGNHAPEITVNGPGYGLCQWTSADRQQNLVNFAAANGKSTSDAGVQCAFIVTEMPEIVSLCNSAQDPEEAARIFHSKFERSDDENSNPSGLINRQNWAREAFENNGDIAGANGSNISASNVSAGSNKNNGGSETKKYSGLYGAFDKMNDTLGGILNSFGNGKYGRYKYGRALTTPSLTPDYNLGTVMSTPTATNVSTNNVVPTTVNPVQSSSSSGGIFDNFLSPYQGTINKLKTGFNAAMAPVKGVFSKLANSPIGKALTNVFGDNPFQFNSQSSNRNSSKGGNSTAGGNSSNPNINAASAYANSRVGTEGTGNNGCTAWVNEYLQKAGINPIDLWTPTAMSNSQQKNSPAGWKDPSQGAVEGDVAVIETNNDWNDGPDHVVIADGQGGYWGNSSSSGQIVHGSMGSDWGSNNIYGYIGTGGDGQGNVAQGNMARSSSDANADATNGQGKYGRGKYGRAKNNHLYKSKYGKGFIYGKSVMAVRKKIDMLNKQKNSVFGRGYYGKDDVFSQISNNNSAASALSTTDISSAVPTIQPISSTPNISQPVVVNQNTDKIDTMINLLSSMNGYLAIIAQGIGGLANVTAQPGTSPLAVLANNASGVSDTFNKDHISEIVGDMLKIASK